MRKLMLVWLGQLLSLLGSAMTRFVLAIWLWQQTGQATSLVLVGVFSTVFGMLTNLVAGSVVDRVSRKLVIIVADLMLALTTGVLLTLAWVGLLQAWHIYVSAALGGIFNTFHWLSFSTSITLVVPKQHYTRANSMISVAHYASTIGSPVVAGMLLGPIGIQGVMLIDVFTCFFAVGSILMLQIPRVVQKDSHKWKNLEGVRFGFKTIFSQPALRGFMLMTFAFILAESFGYPLIAPMVLARTGGDEMVLGLVQSMLGVGGVVGGVAVSVWGGFKRKVNGVIVGLVFTGLLGDMLMGVGGGLAVWLTAAVFIELFIPLAFSSHDAIWQAKIAPGQQGRVFAARDMLLGVGEPIALLSTGLMADHLFEPAMMPGGVLAPTLGWLTGSGPGAGMGLLLFVSGIVCAGAAAWGYAYKPVREIEQILPDHEVADPSSNPPHSPQT